MGKLGHNLLTFLGAGASRPEICGVRELTGFLLDWAKRREPPNDASAFPGKDLLLHPRDDDKRLPLFQAIANIVRPTLRDPGALNYEHLIHVCEQLGTWFPLPQGTKLIDQFRTHAAPFLQVNDKLERFNIPGYIVAAQDACFDILDRVADDCDRIAEPSNHPQARGLAALAESSRVRIFSLNYDDLPYASGLDLYDGFDKAGLFRPEYPWPTDCHMLAQLHGSVSWGGDSPLKRYTNRDDARKNRTTRSGPRRHMDGQMTSSVPMITGLRKSDRIMDHPFGTYFHVLRDELLRCPTWLIIGYGFGDPHINNAMIQARANWQQRGDVQRTVVVDWYDFEEADERAYRGTPAGDWLSSKLDAVFGNDVAEFIGQRRLVKAVSGQLNEISDRLAVWMNGGESAFIANRDQLLAWLFQA